MNLNSLFHQCLYFCIVIIIFTLALNFVSALWFDTGAIPVDVDMGRRPTDNANQTFFGLIDSALMLPEGFGGIFLLGISAGMAIAIGVSYLSGQTTPLAVYLFGMIFWTSYLRSMAVISPLVPTEILFIFTVAIMFLFGGAVVAILGYSG